MALTWLEYEADEPYTVAVIVIRLSPQLPLVLGREVVAVMVAGLTFRCLARRLGCRWRWGARAGLWGVATGVGGGAGRSWAPNWNHMVVHLAHCQGEKGVNAKAGFPSPQWSIVSIAVSWSLWEARIRRWG